MGSIEKQSNQSNGMHQIIYSIQTTRKQKITMMKMMTGNLLQKRKSNEEKSVSKTLNMILQKTNKEGKEKEG